jgi:aconitate hydratase
LKVTAETTDGQTITFTAIARIDSLIEVKYYENGGILQYVLRDFLGR